MTLLYFVAGVIAALAGIGAFAILFGTLAFGGDTGQLATAALLVAAAFVFGVIAWWAAREGANRWP